MNRREVMDASAVLALLQREPGAENVDLKGATMNSVNFAEVVQKTVARERPVDALLRELTLLGLSVTPFSPQEAQLAGELYQRTRTHGSRWPTAPVWRRLSSWVPWRSPPTGTGATSRMGFKCGVSADMTDLTRASSLSLLERTRDLATMSEGELRRLAAEAARDRDAEA